MKSCYDKEDRKVERGGFFFSKKKKRTRHNRRLIQLIDGITLCDGGLIFVFFSLYRSGEDPAGKRAWYGWPPN